MIQEFKQIFGAGVNLDLDDLAMQVGQTREIHNLRFDNFNSSNKGALSTFKGTQLIDNYVALPPGKNIVIGAKAYHEENAVIFFVWNENNHHSIRLLSPDLGHINIILQQGYRGPHLSPESWGYDLNFRAGARITHINIIGDLLFWINTANEPNRINIKKAIYFNSHMSQGYSRIDSETCRAAKSPPIMPPVVTYATDLNKSFSNLLRGNNYQFKYSYVYADSDLTTTSPISAPKFANGDFDVSGDSNPYLKKNNQIKVSVNTGGQEVTQIRLYVQVNNLGDWALFKEIDKVKDGIAHNSTTVVNFYGTELGYGVDQNYINQLYSRVPILARSQEFIDNKYLTYGGVLDGRDYLSSKDVDYSLHAEKVDLFISNGEPTVRNMPVYQYDGEVWVDPPDPIGGDENPPVYGDSWFISVYPHPQNQYVISNKIYIKIINNSDGAEVEINDLVVNSGNQNSLPDIIAQKIRASAPWVDARVAYMPIVDGVAVRGVDWEPLTIIAQEIGFLAGGFDSASAQGGTKFGATTAIGITYGDKDGRLSGTNEIAEISIPWYNELTALAQGEVWSPNNPGKMHGVLDDEFRYRILIDLVIKHRPPVWAHVMHIVATRPMQVGSFLQTKVGFSRVIGKPWVLMDMTEYNEKANKINFASSNLRAYIFNKGDRVRVISYDKKLSTRVTSYIEAEIIGYDLDNENNLDANKVRVAGNMISNHITGDVLPAVVEIYTPTPYGDTRVYREIMSLPIVNPGTLNAMHAGTIEDQNNIEPAKITLDMVNCFHHPRLFGEDDTGIVRMVEDFTYSDYVKSIDATGMGRVSVYDKSIKEVYRNSVIYSEPYFDNTNINGLSMFPLASRYKALGDEKGSITGMRYSGNTLIVFMERDNLSIYVGKAGLAQAQQDGREIVVSTDEVLSSTYPSTGGYGTTHPESIVMVGRNAYFFDKAHSAIIRRSVNGLDPISDMYGIHSDIVNIVSTLKQYYNTYVISGYNNRYKEVYFTFVAKNNAGTVVFNKTWAFGVEAEDRNEFKYQLSLVDPKGNAPECYVNNGDEFYGFMEGNAWLHDATDETNKFYGTYQRYSVKFVVNPDPDTIKTFDAISLVTNKRWSALFQVVQSENLRYGMESTLEEPELKSEEGGFYSDIHGNMISQYTGDKNAYNMINGELLRGHAMRVTLYGGSTTPAYLLVVKIGFSHSSVS